MFKRDIHMFVLCFVLAACYRLDARKGQLKLYNIYSKVETTVQMGGDKRVLLGTVHIDSSLSRTNICGVCVCQSIVFYHGMEHQFDYSFNRTV